MRHLSDGTCATQCRRHTEHPPAQAPTHPAAQTPMCRWRKKRCVGGTSTGLELRETVPPGRRTVEAAPGLP